MINLLPPEYKEELWGEERLRLVLTLGILLGVFLVCLALALLSIRVYVWGEINAQQILVESQRKEGGESDSTRIRELNTDVAAIVDFYTKRVPLADVIARIEPVLPENVYLTSFSYATGSPRTKISLKGFASLTEDLLAFKVNLEQDPSFENFSFPQSNWIRAADIDFSFDFEL